MSEVANSQPHHMPELTRRAWQISAGTVVVRNLAGGVIASDEPGNFLGSANYGVTKERARIIRERRGIENETWAQAFAITQNSLQVPESMDYKVADNEVIREQFWEFTAMRSIPAVLEEGMVTQRFLPLNMAMAISKAAAQRGVAGFESNSLSDIAGILRRPDFQELIHTAARTRQGIWRQFADMAVPEYTPLKHGGVDLDFQFNDDGAVAFAPEFAQMLKRELQRVNRDGIDRGVEIVKSEMASSGCPVARKRAIFSGDAMEYLPMLSEAFDQTPEELLRPREKTVIHEGLDKTALVLEAAEQYLRTGKEYSSKRHSRIRRLAHKALRFVRLR